MTKLVLDAETIAKLQAAGPEVLIVAENGAEIALAKVGNLHADEEQLSVEEIDRRCAGPGRPLADIIRDLKAKYGE